MNRRRKGEQYEVVAADFLEQKGFRIVERNYRCSHGEIDLIVEQNALLVFVEVKMRSSAEFGRPQEAVTRKKQHRIIRTAQHYLSSQSNSAQDYRFDVIAISKMDEDEPVLEHIENAFQADEEDIVVSPAVASNQFKKSNMRFSDSNLVYREQGIGKRVCLFLHGFPTNSLLWKQVIPVIASAGWHCYAPDQLGLGESDGPADGDFSLNAQAEALHQFVNRLQLKDLVLVGHDTGGGVAQILATRWPDRVRGMVLTNSVAFSNWPVRIVRLLKLALRVGLGRWILDPKRGRKWANGRFGFPAGYPAPKQYDPATSEQYLEPLLRNAFRRNQFRRYIAAMSNAQTKSLEAGLRSFNRPVRVAWAERDRLLSAGTGRRLAKVFPNGEYCPLLQGGHFHIDECPEQFCGVLLAFLNQFED